MTEKIMNTKALPEFLFNLIQTEKVKVRETDGEIRLMPIFVKSSEPKKDSMAKKHFPLMNNPFPVENFKLFSREELHER